MKNTLTIEQIIIIHKTLSDYKITFENYVEKNKAVNPHTIKHLEHIDAIIEWTTFNIQDISEENTDINLNLI